MVTPRSFAAMSAAAVLGGLALAGGAQAHHGWGSYDSTTVTSLAGTVRSVSFANPHASIQLDADGKTWFIVLAPPSRMTARGLPEGTLKEGQAVELEGYVHRGDDTELRAESITVDGNTVALR
jgi:Family of unknown function (DUF6152)